MNKAILLMGAVPLVCAAVGFGAGTALKPGAAEAVAHDAPSPHAAAEEALEQLAHDSPEPPLTEAPAHMPVPDESGAAHAPAAEVAAAAPAHPPKAPEVAEAKPAAHSPEGPELADAGHGAAAGDEMSDSRVVQVGRISVPVYKPHSVTYVVADFGVAVEDEEDVARYSVAENATRLRDAILTSMHRVAETPMLKGPAIDSDELADVVAGDLKPDFDGVKGVLFLSLHKTDVPRS